MSRALIRVLRRNLIKAMREEAPEQAQALLDRLKSEDPLSVETRGLELEFLVFLGRLDEAQRLATQLCRVFPDSGRIQFLSGKTAYRQRRYEDALHHFEESHRIVPHWRSRYWMGKTLTQLGAFDRALDCLEQVRAKNPYVENDLAWLFERMGQVEKAIKALERHLKVVPDDRGASARLVKLKGTLLEPQSLIEEVDELQEMGEEIPEHLLPLFVENLIRCGQIERARQTVRANTRRLPSNVGLNVAWVCYRLQIFDLAFDLFLSQLETRARDFKMLNALEQTARKIDRLGALKEAYFEAGERHKNLLGRAKRIPTSPQDNA